MTPPLPDPDLRALVWDAVHRAPAVDVATGLHDPRFGSLLRHGADALLDTPALRAEARRAALAEGRLPAAPRGGDGSAPAAAPVDFDRLPPAERAARIWRTVFVERSPVSEAARTALTALGMLGIDCRARDLAHYRAPLAATALSDLVDRAFAAAHVKWAVAPCDPFDDGQRAVWEAKSPPAPDPRFRASLSLDALARPGKAASRRLREWGFDAGHRVDKRSAPELRRFLAGWNDRARPVHWSLSLPGDFDPAGDGPAARLLRKAVLPELAERGGPPPFLHWPADPGADRRSAPTPGAVLAEYAAAWPAVRFVASAGDDGDAAGLVDAARTAANTLFAGENAPPAPPEGWERTARRAMETLGGGFVAAASRAGSLEELPGRWARTRWRLGLMLQEQYDSLWRTGWRPSAAEIERDARDLLGGAFVRFAGPGR